ncbi:hypothetical protein [Streptomyces cirratus]|uniref:hypothetical protein n=1 Tax=Streptomyces cirratus TaxID=68187 RepID=UPI003613F34F
MASRIRWSSREATAEGAADEARALALAVRDRLPTRQPAAAAVGTGTGLVIALNPAARKAGLNASALVKQLLGGRGGGSAELAQGGGLTTDAIDRHVVAVRLQGVVDALPARAVPEPSVDEHDVAREMGGTAKAAAASGAKHVWKVADDGAGEDLFSGWSTDADADALTGLAAREVGASLCRLTAPARAGWRSGGRCGWRSGSVPGRAACASRSPGLRACGPAGLRACGPAGRRLDRLGSE